VREIFEERRFRVYDAPDGTQGIALARTLQLDIILLDIDMPKMTGIEVCRSLKTDLLTKYIPVIFLTAENTLEMVKEGLAAGAKSYVLKPFDTKDLLDRVYETLGIGSDSQTENRP